MSPMRWGKVENQSTCPICMDTFENTGETTLNLPCHHIFHSCCLKDLSRYDNRCPLCRKAFYTHHTCSYCDYKLLQGDDMFDNTFWDIGIPQGYFHAECVVEQVEEMLDFIKQLIER